ncbi:MAG TPA: hypothetical protein HA257_05320 [Candidatus Methanoperedenaceae archaeon]|nr:hypothetical protein [Candidatus Methanoperedenaceae archaeon]
MGMMDWYTDSTSQWAYITLIAVIIILGMAVLYLNYMMLSELKDMKRLLERIRKLLETVQ